jgi:hypothetical protein
LRLDVVYIYKKIPRLVSPAQEVSGNLPGLVNEGKREQLALEL